MNVISGRICLWLAVLACVAGFAAPSRCADKPAVPQQQAAAPQPPPPAYEAQLNRLAQVLGSVDYLRQLCEPDSEDRWRETMQTLLDTETTGEPERTRKLTAAFNRGYRSFASVYTACTESAVAAERKYRREGATLASQIAGKYGN